MNELIEHSPARATRSAAALLAAGGVCGLAWAAGLRGFMAALAGSGSEVAWYGTFAQILLPGVITGVLLGWAEYIRRTGGRRGWRWLALAPLAFPLFVFATPQGLEALLDAGLGGGAIAVPLFGMAGGYALSGRGPRWARIVLGVVALAPIPIWAFTASGFGPAFAVTSPRGAWVALFFYSFIATLTFACSIPHRAAVRPEMTTAMASAEPEATRTAGEQAGQAEREKTQSSSGAGDR
jgi:hypothetical protein